jgi:hypothetical protein
VPCGGFSDRADLLGLRTLGPASNGVLDSLVVLEAAVTVNLDSGVVDEDVGRAVVWGDETVPLVRVEPLHCSLSHLRFLPQRRSGSTGVHPGLLGPPDTSEAWPRDRRRPLSELRRRCDTDTNFDYNQIYLTPWRQLMFRVPAYGRVAIARKAHPGVAMRARRSYVAR